MPAHSDYRGRFAPSPTGPLHLGSLVAALASFLDARRAAGVWLVRMEDLDPPREEAGAANRILNSLLRHGLNWDDEVLFQSTRSEAYQDALRLLDERGLLFDCDCSRSQLGPAGACGNRCRGQRVQVKPPSARRVIVPPQTYIAFEDGLQGLQGEALGATLSDFVVKRRDGLDAYQLAVVVDDAAQRISHVVRGADLLDATPRQVYLQQALAVPTPHYSHVPVITNDAGQKLSKQNRAPALDDNAAPSNLRSALRCLGQTEPATDSRNVTALLEHAVRHWDPARIPAGLAHPSP